MTESATTRLARLLTMVPWLVNRQGIDIDRAAEELGVSRRQIEADLSLLFVCGTPGHLPDDLIEAEWEHGRVFLRNADTIARPLRLGRDEAMALVVGLRALAAVPGLQEHDAIDRALAKLTQAAGMADDTAHERVRVELSDATHAETLATLRAAVAGHRRVHLRYLVPTRDESTQRDVDPMRLVTMSGHWYFEGWCHRAEDVRLFRLDRVEEATVLEEDGTPPERATPRDVETTLFQHGPDDVTATVRLAPEAAWVVDYYPVEQVDRADDGSLRVQLRTADVRWLARLMWRLGGSASVLEPASLRERVAVDTAEALAQYDG